MFYAHLGTQYPNHEILYVNGIRTKNVDEHTGSTALDLKRIIDETGAKEVVFGGTSLPRRSVPVTHENMQRYIRKFAKLYG